MEERENRRLAAFCMPPIWDQPCSLGMCPGWELNRQPLGPWDDARLTDPYRPGQQTPFSSLYIHTYYSSQRHHCLPPT